MLYIPIRYDPVEGRRVLDVEGGGGLLLHLFAEAIALSNRLECGVCFRFNDTTITLWGRDNPVERLAEYWHREGWSTEAIAAWVRRQMPHGRNKPMSECPTCHSPKRWEWTYCTTCHAAIDCRCCDCATLATLPETIEEE